MRRMCVQRIESRGSSEVAAPGGIFSWPPWAEAREGMRRRVERRRGG
jgi:hypothetical protein